ncbi:fumarylacetoacetate hydrolase family protein [Dactylosporangium sp. CA-092794]|uniref:fumarylacetoacetate hydrolase family protein n=1 Tax=Dactylosporangium sp. CA-092794 TaxID=3239929 RepID=UPI003D8A7996
MQLLSFLDPAGQERLGVADRDGTVRDITAPLVGALGPAGGVSLMRRLLTAGLDPAALSTFAASAGVADVARLLPPVPDPSKIVAAPVNYRDHQAEMSSDFAVDGLGVFLKAPSSLVGDGAVVRLPYADRRFDQEGELAVVIGRPASHVAPADALRYVAGYTCLLDMTMRGGEDRSTRKSFDTFTPAGPRLVTPDEVGDVAELELHTWVNGRLRQRADLADLVWDVPRLIGYISSVMQLLPGDVIATGTPAGVGEVDDGDEVVVEITRVGRLAATVDATTTAACPTLGRGRGPVPPAALTAVRERR